MSIHSAWKELTLLSTQDFIQVVKLELSERITNHKKQIEELEEFLQIFEGKNNESKSD